MVVYPTIYRVLYISGGCLGFLPFRCLDSIASRCGQFCLGRCFCWGGWERETMEHKQGMWEKNVVKTTRIFLGTSVFFWPAFGCSKDSFCCNWVESVGVGGIFSSYEGCFFRVLETSWASYRITSWRHDHLILPLEGVKDGRSTCEEAVTETNRCCKTPSCRFRDRGPMSLHL